MSEKNPHYGATFAERKAARETDSISQAEPKQVDVETVEDKAMQPASTKRTARKKS